MSTPQLILYDLARRGGNACWSFNVWKIRLALNYKRIPYQTHWLTHAEITPYFSDLDLSPNPPGAISPYTLPVIRLPSGQYVMDSAAIAAKLEEVYPDRPSLHLDPELQEQLTGLLAKIGRALAPVFMPIFAREVLVEDSVPYFREARKKAFGMDLEEFEAVRGGEKAFEAARGGVQELVKFVQGKKMDGGEGDGPFLLGRSVSYADFMIVALMLGMRQAGERIFERVFGEEKVFMRLYDATAEWRERDT